MITPAQIEALAKIIVGDAPGWQTRFAKITGVSNGHISNIVIGLRPVTQIIALKIIKAARQQSAVLRDRADEVDAMLQQMPTMAEFAAMPRGDTQGQGDDE